MPPKSNSSGAPAPKLSSGILGMKFMRKDEDSDEKLSNAKQEEESTRIANKFQHEEDPGAWFSSGSNVIKKVEKNSNNVDFNDIYGAKTPEIGRKSYGVKPVSKAEEMSTDEKKSNGGSKNRKVSGSKRASSESTRTSTKSKQRRKS